MIGQTIAHYRIDRQLGEGGMGVVYAAQDLKLERPVALKVIRANLSEPGLRDRFWREARAAAALNHPNVCHLYEIREEGGELFITMELLEGETVAETLARGPLLVDQVVRIGLDVLAALDAVHRRGFVHRDVKPSNVFLLADGRVKLLDFGLVLPVKSKEPAAKGGLTVTGLVMGSPRYMSPEQIRGEAVDARTDLFSLAALLYETASGQPPFEGTSSVESMYAVLNQRAPRLGGSAIHEALGGVLGRAMSKSPDQRFSDASSMAAELRALGSTPSAGIAAPSVEEIKRLAVLPFRMLRPDADLEFLGPSLADAIAMSLAGLRSLVVRSPVASARFAGPAPDLAEIGKALDVDVVLVGTVLPAGARCRVAAQLVEAPGGEVIWSQTSDVAGEDVFELQDQLVRRIVDSLQVPLSPRERGAIGRDVPASPGAYEFFLRANRIAAIGRDFEIARDLYRESIGADPSYAPAWARLGRCYRVLGKFYRPEGREENYRLAEEALDKALELHPDFPTAIYYMAQLELDGGRIDAALDRLLRLVEHNPNDPEGHAGLVTALRYAGLLDASLAADQRTRALDPKMATSVHYTLESMGQIEKALELCTDQLAPVRGRLLARARDEESALRTLRDFESREQGSIAAWLATLCRAAIEGDREAGARAGEMLRNFSDPEGRVLHAAALAHLGLTEAALDTMEHAVDLGYANVRFFDDPWMDPVRQHPRFVALVARAEAHHRELAARYAGRPAHLMPEPAA